MSEMYWVFEYGKVFLAYCFLVFLWPSVVFHRLLKGKSLTFRVCFCATGSIVLVNTVVLFLGLLHLLNKYTVWLFFYGIFAFFLLRMVPFHKKYIRTLQRLFNREYGLKMFLSRTLHYAKMFLTVGLKRLWLKWKPHFIEYLVLFILIVYGVIYFSWGAFHDHSYGFGDMYVHHSWIYSLTLGTIFSDGVYPEAMHCFIYAMHTLFGIKIYSCLLFLAGVHMVVYLLSAYCMLKEVFRWRGSVLLAMTLFLIVKMDCIDGVFSMSRLQWTLPQEFGLFTQFLCAAFFVRYLRSSHHPKRGRKTTRLVWDENLLVFGLAISASFSIHFYTTIMAFFLCFCFLVFSLRKTFRKTHFLPLAAAAFLGVAASTVPMAGALASGIPFQGSINWAMNIITGTDTKEGRGQNSAAAQTPAPAPNGGTSQSIAPGAQGPASQGSSSGTETGGSPNSEILPGTAENAAPKPSVLKKLGSIFNWGFSKLSGVLPNGYYTLYPHQARLYLLISVLSLILLGAYRAVVGFLKKYIPDLELDARALNGHAPLLLASYVFLFLYAAPLIGLPELVAGSRLCSTIHLLLMGVAVMPLDLLFTIFTPYLSAGLMDFLFGCTLAALCLLVVQTGYYHGYLYFELTRYNGAVNLTQHLIGKYPQYSYTVVSPTDELYQTIQYGRHTDLYEFMTHIKYDKQYYIPTEYIFVYVEKHPLEYAQSHFFDGPGWLAQKIYPALYTSYVSQCPEISGSEVSAESAKELYRTTLAWPIYTHLVNRTVLESRAYFWCQDFAKLYTYETEVYYEDKDIICYRIHQNPKRPFNMVID